MSASTRAVRLGLSSPRDTSPDPGSASPPSPHSTPSRRSVGTETPTPPADIAACVTKGAAALRATQHGDGYWKGELETNVTMDAEDLLLRELLGIRRERETAACVAWIRSQQRQDGTWANFYGGPADLSTTVEAYVALRLGGEPAESSHMRAAARYIVGAGGIERTRVFTRIWLALFGLWPWEALPVLPPEIMFLPARVPLNIYDFACWARQTIVALSVVSAHRPVHELGFGVDELRSGASPPPRSSLTTWAGRFQLLDRLLHRYERRPIGFVRRAALARAERWILERQEADGSWGGIQPPWVYSLIALWLQGFALDHPSMAAGIAGLDGFTITDERGRRLEACQSPVWDTALAVIALSDAGASPEDPAVTAATRWLLGEEIRVPGDWRVRRPDLEPGGWAFEFANDHYPDIDDTAEVVLALRRAAVSSTEAVERAVDWVEGMQCRDGGWGAFDVDNTQDLCRRLPFCDFGELIDPPSADVTAHVVEMLAQAGGERSAIESGVAWLLGAQEPDGSWFGRWGANFVYGTGAVVPALLAAGVPAGHEAVRGAVAWLERHQNDDGGWGEDLRSYDDPTQAGRGPSTASQTAWALLALLAAAPRSPAIDSGVGYLVCSQRHDGTWDEPYYTGTGFPGYFYINYHLYRQVFPLMAMGRFVKGAGHG
jgi:squalene-hopene/tetraprenyl-beta-curcumene cyclase